MAEKIRSILETKGSAVWGVSPRATVFDALKMLAEKDVGALLVLEEGHLVGVFSERDYARKVVLMGKSSRDILVADIMTSDVITVSPEHSIGECMRIITEHHIRHLPVVDRSGALAGVISIGDIVNAIISAQAATIEHLSSYIAGDYPK